jgi:hypothetical protein
MSGSESDPLAGLGACYAAARDLTTQLRRALDSDQLDRLDELAGERHAQLERAARLLAELPDSPQGVSASQRARVSDELTLLIKEDQLLRAALSARAQALPAQLTELRAAQAALGGYEAGGVGGRADSPPEVDRRG